MLQGPSLAASVSPLEPFTEVRARSESQGLCASTTAKPGSPRPCGPTDWGCSRGPLSCLQLDPLRTLRHGAQLPCSPEFVKEKRCDGKHHLHL